MRRVLTATAVTAVVLIVSGSAASGGPPGTASLSEYGRAIMAADASIAVRAGEEVAVQTLELPPGASRSWTSPSADALVLITRGMVTVASTCAGEEAKRWEAGRAYHRPPGIGLVKNESREPAGIVLVGFNARPPLAPAPESCAGADPLAGIERGRGVAVSDGAVDVEGGKQVIVQQFVVEPGFNFFWHHHPPALIVQLRGRLTAYLSCTEQEVWEPGYAYHHTPGHHGHQRQTVKNEGDETAEAVALFYNAPEWLPPPLFGRDVQPPYPECPTRSLL